DLRGPAERARERHGRRRGILAEARIEDGELLLRAQRLDPRLERGARDHLEDLADVEVLLLVEEVSNPLLVVEAAVDGRHAFRPVILEELVLFLIGFAHERERSGETPSLVVRLLFELEVVELAVRLDLERIEPEHLAILED